MVILNHAVKSLSDCGWIGVMEQDRYIVYEMDETDHCVVVKFVFDAGGEWGFSSYTRDRLFCADVVDDMIASYSDAHFVFHGEYPQYPDDWDVLERCAAIRKGVSLLEKVATKLQHIFEETSGPFDIIANPKTQNLNILQYLSQKN